MADNAQLSSPEDNDDAVAGDASDHEVPGDAGEVDMVAAVHDGELGPAISNVSVREVKAFELEFELNGVTIKKQFNGAIQRVNNCTFVNVDCPDMTFWIQSHVTYPADDKPKYIKSKLQGFAALRDARDLMACRLQVGWGPDDFPEKRPTPYLLRSMKARGTIICLNDVSFEVNVCDLIVRVLPKLQCSNQQCWVCADDLPKVISIVQRMGVKVAEPPKGIYKRVNKKNPSGYSFQIRVRGKSYSCKTEEDAIEKLGQL